MAPETEPPEVEPPEVEAPPIEAPPLPLLPAPAPPRRARLRTLIELPAENPLARFVMMNLLGQGGSLLIGFFTSILLARLLGPSGRGLFGLMASVAGIVVVVAAIGLPTAVTYFSSLPDADPPAMLGNALVHAALLGAIIIPGSWLLHGQIARAVGHGDGGETWVLVSVLVLLTLLDYTTNSQLQGALRFARANLVVVVSRLAYALTVVLAIAVFSLGVTGGVIALCVGSLVMILASLRPILQRGRPRVHLGLMRRTLGYGARAEVGSILQLANGRLDVLILQAYRPLSQVGYYIVAQTVAELLAILANEFRWTSMVLVTRQGDDKRTTTSADAIRHYVIVAAVGAVAIAGFGSLLIEVGYGTAFHAALVPMLILLPGVCMLGLGFVVAGDLSGRGRPGLASVLSGLSAAVTTALDFVLIPGSGPVGAAIASLCGYSVLGLVSVVVLRRIAGISVREMIVPTRADMAAYGGFFAARLGGLRGGKT